MENFERSKTLCSNFYELKSKFTVFWMRKNLFNIVIKIKCLFTNKIKSNVFTTFIKFIIKH